MSITSKAKTTILQREVYLSSGNIIGFKKSKSKYISLYYQMGLHMRSLLW